MIYKLLYTKQSIRWFRIISVLCVILLAIVEGWAYYRKIPFITDLNQGCDYYVIFARLVNHIAIVFFVFVSVFPQKFGFTAIIAYIYAVMIMCFEPENYMGIMMYFLGTSILFARGLLRKHQKCKLISLSVVLLCLLFTQLRFGLKSFVYHLLINLGGILILGLFTFFLRAYYSNTLMYEDKKLNLGKYKGLKSRDFKILKMIQNDVKYTVIAKQYNITLGTLKNRLHEVFDIMEVGDRQGFLSCYKDYELCYSEEGIQEAENNIDI